MYWDVYSIMFEVKIYTPKINWLKKNKKKSSKIICVNLDFLIEELMERGFFLSCLQWPLKELQHVVPLSLHQILNNWDSLLSNLKRNEIF